MTIRKNILQRVTFGLAIGLGILYALYMIGCLRDPGFSPKDSVSLALDWNGFMLKAEINSEGYRGPVSSRAYGYIGLAAYEAALPGLEGNFQSMTEHFKGIQLPTPPNQEHFNLAISLNACYSAIMSKFFMASPDPVRQERMVMEEKWDKILSHGVDTATVRMSKSFGTDVGNAVFEWSATDSLGYRSNHHNYDRNYFPPSGDGKWVTSFDFPMPALLPYWGKVRPFVIQTERYLAKAPPPFSTETNQPYQVQALEIISLSSPLTAENQWIGDFWNDDHPGLTFTPPGHWLSIANQVIRKEHPPIEKTLETYMKIGFALADAMIACWYSKYEYNLERPETYIQKHIDKNWRSFSPSPSFPSYPSGHAMMGAAAAEVLSDLYGSTYDMMDCSHEGFKEFVVKPRSFMSFDQMAKENALSRIFIGVHWRMDCEEGLRLGSLIGKEVNQLPLEKKLTE